MTNLWIKFMHNVSYNTHTHSLSLSFSFSFSISFVLFFFLSFSLSPSLYFSFFRIFFLSIFLYLWFSLSLSSPSWLSFIKSPSFNIWEISDREFWFLKLFNFEWVNLVNVCSGIFFFGFFSQFERKVHTREDRYFCPTCFHPVKWVSQLILMFVLKGKRVIGIKPVSRTEVWWCLNANDVLYFL